MDLSPLSRRAFLAALGASAAALPAGTRAFGGAGPPPALLLHGGPIHLGAGGRVVEALLVRDGRVAFAGRLAEAPARGVRRIDLAGAAAFPGLVDAHAHLLGIGLREIRLNLAGTRSIAALQAALGAHAAAHPAGPIVGRGWIETHWPEARMPTRADLDAVVADRPVWLDRADGHAGVANSAALALAGIDAATRDPAGGRIERDAAGAATGVLIDNAAALVEARLPSPGPETVRLALARAVALYAARGWTGVADMGMRADVRAILHEMAAAGSLPIRVDCYMADGEAAAVLADGPSADPTGLVRTLGVKLYVDGALGSRGALLLAPYGDRPETSGLAVTPVEHIRARLAQARRSGAQVATHAIGDRANRMVLDLYAEAWADNPAGLRRARWRVEHAQVIDAADIPRFGKLGVIASMQPSHAIGDLWFAPARLGAARLGGAYAWRSLVDSGAMLCAGSDAPVEKGDPRIEYYAATHRRDLDGRAGPDWHPEQALDRQAALALFTRNAAYAARHEDALGTLEVGMRADVSVFDADVTRIEPAAILQAKRVLTIVDGVASR